jgi:hypothetical protein
MGLGGNLVDVIGDVLVGDNVLQPIPPESSGRKPFGKAFLLNCNDRSLMAGSHYLRCWLVGDGREGIKDNIVSITPMIPKTVHENVFGRLPA